LLVRFSDVLTFQDYADVDRAIIEFASRRGHADIIYDFSKTTAVAVPQGGFAFWRQQPPISVDCNRIFVAPRDDLHEEALEIARQQVQLGFRRPHVTKSIDEAFQLLQIGKPFFELVLPADHFESR
jgi:hypothetical protein